MNAAKDTGIKSLLDALREQAPEMSVVEFYEDVARRLSEVAGKDPAWSWRYVKSVESGTVGPSKKLVWAVEHLGAMLDGLPQDVAKTTSVTVYAEPGRIKPGSIILAASKPCAYNGCPIWFVPVVPHQIYHSPACRKAAWRERVRKMSDEQEAK